MALCGISRIEFLGNFYKVFLNFVSFMFHLVFYYVFFNVLYFVFILCSYCVVSVILLPFFRVFSRVNFYCSISVFFVITIQITIKSLWYVYV